jgi:hypothetical protein
MSENKINTSTLTVEFIDFIVDYENWICEKSDRKPMMCIDSVVLPGTKYVRIMVETADKTKSVWFWLMEAPDLGLGNGEELVCWHFHQPSNHTACNARCIEEIGLAEMDVSDVKRAVGAALKKEYESPME